jgi:hypothetical protein
LDKYIKTKNRNRNRNNGDKKTEKGKPRRQTTRWNLSHLLKREIPLLCILCSILSTPQSSFANKAALSLL